MQGNNLWLTRQLAALREAQGDVLRAAELRALAGNMAAETVATMYATSPDGGRGWFNVLYPLPPPPTASPNNRSTKGTTLVAHEMRHVVDFFSLAFGMCADTHRAAGTCDLDAAQRAQLSAWFHKELLVRTAAGKVLLAAVSRCCPCCSASAALAATLACSVLPLTRSTAACLCTQTRNWIRATSPYCNCSHTWEVAVGGTPPAPVPAPPADAPYPALVTCKGDREDHGTTGAYTAWPAAAAEALCYIDGNCSAAFDLLAGFAAVTVRGGGLGQAYAVPQQREPPYTPYDDEPAFKPNDRRYLNMAVGAFFDGIVRGLFGYQPDMLWPDASSSETEKQAALDATLLAPRAPRGFAGKLSNLRTPLGLATITSDSAGLSIALQDGIQQ